MIEITETQFRVLEAYLQRGNYARLHKELEITHDQVRYGIAQLQVAGVLRKRSDNRHGFERTDLGFRVVPDRERQSVRAEQNKVAMSNAERAWMLSHYKKYRHNRSEAARILDRSRLEINYMAIKLGLGEK